MLSGEDCQADQDLALGGRVERILKSLSCSRSRANRDAPYMLVVRGLFRIVLLDGFHVVAEAQGEGARRSGSVWNGSTAQLIAFMASFGSPPGHARINNTATVQISRH